MSILEPIVDYFKGKAKKVPGLGYVATGISAIAALALNRPEHDFPFFVVWIVWLVAFLFYYFSGILDDIIFEPLYGIRDPDLKGWKRKWFPLARWIFLPIEWMVNLLPRTKRLAEVRKRAADTLNPENYLCRGIYSSAKMFFGKSEDWERRVELWLDLSKAARAFIIPLLILLLLDLSQELAGAPDVKTFLNHRVLNWFGLWYVASISLALLVILSLWFRLLHMVALYDLIHKSDVLAIVASGVKDKSRNIDMLRIGTVIIPTDELPIYTEARKKLSGGG